TSSDRPRSRSRLPAPDRGESRASSRIVRRRRSRVPRRRGRARAPATTSRAGSLSPTSRTVRRSRTSCRDLAQEPLDVWAKSNAIELLSRDWPQTGQRVSDLATGLRHAEVVDVLGAVQREEGERIGIVEGPNVAVLL